jgi:hypothetical protein
MKLTENKIKEKHVTGGLFLRCNKCQNEYSYIKNKDNKQSQITCGHTANLVFKLKVKLPDNTRKSKVLTGVTSSKEALKELEIFKKEVITDVESQKWRNAGLKAAKTRAENRKKFHEKPVNVLDSLQKVMFLSPLVRKLILNDGSTSKEIAKDFKISLEEVTDVKLRIENNLKLIADKETNRTIKNFKNVQTLKSWDDDDRKGKKEVREVKADLVENQAVKYGLIEGSCLTLPADKCMAEKLINSKPHCSKLTFKGLEYLFAVFTNLKRNISKEKLFFMKCINHGNIIDEIAVANEGSYIHAFLDFCGLLKTYKTCIKEAIRKKIVKVHGIIEVTLSCQRSLGGGDAVIAEFKKMLQDEGGNNFKLVKILRYNDEGIKQDDDDKAKMVAFFIERIK